MYHDISPICIWVKNGIRTIFEFLNLSVSILWSIVGWIAVGTVKYTFVINGCKGCGIQHVRDFGRITNGIVIRGTKLCPAFYTSLGGNKYYTVCSTGTIN